MQMLSNQHWKTLLKNSFLLILLVGCLSPYQEVVKDVEAIDAQYDVDLEFFNYGLEYFDSNARDPPLNQEELNKLVADLQALKAEVNDTEGITYIDFRIALYEAERLYKSASRRTLARYDGLIRCKQGLRLLESVDEVRRAINYTEEAMTLAQNLSDLPLNEDWYVHYDKNNRKVFREARYTYNIVTVNCTQSPVAQE